MTTTVEQITDQRIAREKVIAEIAAPIPPGDYYADGCDVINHETRTIVATCDDHWQACAVMLAITRL